LDLAKAVLVVVDMQRGFVHPNSEHVVPRVVDLVRRWHGAGGALVFTRFHNWPGSPYEKFFQWSALMGSPQTDLIPQLEPYLDHAPVVDKQLYTLFTAEGTKVITDGGWTDVFVCGLTTESCVLKTAVDVFEHHLAPWVVTDACATHAGEEAHEAGLLVLRRFIGRNQLITSADLRLAPGRLEVTAALTETVHHITPAG
jgi:nicotinamidase-related amidase